MRRWMGLWILLYAAVAFADESLEAQKHALRGHRWFNALQYTKAIEEYEQSYLTDGKVLRLNRMAECYEKMAATEDSAAEAAKSKRRALQLYETFLTNAPDTDPEMAPFRKAATARIESLRQEIKELAAQVNEEREDLKSQLKAINEKLQLLIDHLLSQERNKALLRQTSIPLRSQ